jgi:hypothetical protein
MSKCQLNVKEAIKQCTINDNCKSDQQECLQDICKVNQAKQCANCTANGNIVCLIKCQQKFWQCEKYCNGLFDACVNECEQPERDKCADKCKNEADSRIQHNLRFLLNDKLIYEFPVPFGAQINKIRVNILFGMKYFVQIAKWRF